MEIILNFPISGKYYLLKNSLTFPVVTVGIGRNPYEGVNSLSIPLNNSLVNFLARLERNLFTWIKKLESNPSFDNYLITLPESTPLKITSITSSYAKIHFRPPGEKGLHTAIIDFTVLNGCALILPE